MWPILISMAWNRLQVPLTYYLRWIHNFGNIYNIFKTAAFWVSIHSKLWIGCCLSGLRINMRKFAKWCTVQQTEHCIDILARLPIENPSEFPINCSRVRGADWRKLLLLWLLMHVNSYYNYNYKHNTVHSVQQYNMLFCLGSLALSSGFPCCSVAVN